MASQSLYIKNVRTNLYLLSVSGASRSAKYYLEMFLFEGLLLHCILVFRLRSLINAVCIIQVAYQQCSGGGGDSVSGFLSTLYQDFLLGIKTL